MTDTYPQHQVRWEERRGHLVGLHTPDMMITIGSIIAPEAAAHGNVWFQLLCVCEHASETFLFIGSNLHHLWMILDNSFLHGASSLTSASVVVKRY